MASDLGLHCLPVSHKRTLDLYVLKCLQLLAFYNLLPVQIKHFLSSARKIVSLIFFIFMKIFYFMLMYTEYEKVL